MRKHRFTDAEAGVHGHDPEALGAQLAYLRRHRFRLLSLGEVLRRLRSGEDSLERAVAFTVDDGYQDFHRIGLPVFEQFDCPVTLFVATGFLDGSTWLWWDQVRYMLARTDRSSVAVRIASQDVQYEWANETERRTAARDLVARLKTIPEAEKHGLLGTLQESLDVPLPSLPPPRYAPLTWDHVRDAARRGATFGPHSVTHPILSRTNRERAEREIRESWRRLRSESEATVPVFCYPNGDPGSFSEREVAILRDVGLEAAVTNSPGYASPGRFRRQACVRYRLPRFAHSNSMPHFIQVVSGLERVKLAARRALGVDRRR